MTQQYLLGDLSRLLEELERAAQQWQPAVRDLRREVERSPPQALGALAWRVIELTDAICITALEDGDAIRFASVADTSTRAALIASAPL